jgi:hypothetical protein
VTRRVSTHIAALEVTARIIHQLGVPEPACNPFDTLVATAKRAGDEADRPLVALQDVLTWCASHKGRFWGRGDKLSNGAPFVPPAGWLGAWSPEPDWPYIAVSSVEMRKFLNSAGYQASEVIERWDERGWLNKSQKDSRTRPVRLGGAHARCYCVSREAVSIAFADEMMGAEAGSSISAEANRPVVQADVDYGVEGT